MNLDPCELCELRPRETAKRRLCTQCRCWLRERIERTARTERHFEALAKLEADRRSAPCNICNRNPKTPHRDVCFQCLEKEKMTAKAIGSKEARKTVHAITQRVRQRVTHMPSVAEGAELLGISVHDLNNINRGNNVSSTIFFKLTRVGRWSHKSLIEGPSLRKMRKDSPNGATQAKVEKRIRKLATELPGKAVAKATGLSLTGSYGLRYDSGRITLYTILGFANIVPIGELLAGKTK